jgi:hypothetical protein
MSDDLRNTLKSVIDTIQRQQLILQAMSSAVNSTVFLCMDSKERCGTQDCEKVATWTGKSGVACDRHLAENVSTGSTTLDDWQQVPNSEHVRNLETFLDLWRGVDIN